MKYKDMTKTLEEKNDMLRGEIEKYKSEKKFKLVVNEIEVLNMEFEGSTDLVEAFLKTVTDTFGIFYEAKRPMTEVIINNLKVRMETIFRGENGKLVSRDKVFKGTQAS